MIVISAPLSTIPIRGAPPTATLTHSHLHASLLLLNPPHQSKTTGTVRSHLFVHPVLLLYHGLLLSSWNLSSLWTIFIPGFCWAADWPVCSCLSPWVSFPCQQSLAWCPTFLQFQHLTWLPSFRTLSYIILIVTSKLSWTLLSSVGALASVMILLPFHPVILTSFLISGSCWYPNALHTTGDLIKLDLSPSFSCPYSKVFLTFAHYHIVLQYVFSNRQMKSDTVLVCHYVWNLELQQFKFHVFLLQY